MINSFCGMTDWQKAFSLISSQDHCQRSSLLWISDTPWASKIWTCAEPAEFRLCRMKLQPTFATNFIQMLSQLVLTCFFFLQTCRVPLLTESHHSHQQQRQHNNNSALLSIQQLQSWSEVLPTTRAILERAQSSCKQWMKIYTSRVSVFPVAVQGSTGKGTWIVWVFQRDI